MKHIKTFETFISEEGEYAKELKKDIIDKEARAVAAGEEEEEKEEEVDADEAEAEGLGA